jgi:hypothetical protein
MTGFCACAVKLVKVKLVKVTALHATSRTNVPKNFPFFLTHPRQTPLHPIRMLTEEVSAHKGANIRI